MDKTSRVPDKVAISSKAAKVANRELKDRADNAIREGSLAAPLQRATARKLQLQLIPIPEQPAKQGERVAVSEFS